MYNMYCYVFYSSHVIYMGKVLHMLYTSVSLYLYREKLLSQKLMGTQLKGLI